MLNFRRVVLVAFAVFALALPNFADARAGGGKSSMGSRGSRTYSPSSAAPIQRSMIAKPAQTPSGAAQPGYNGAQAAGMPVGSGGSFWRGVAGGFLGAGIGSMLFGHNASAMGGAGAGGGAGGAFGGFLQIILLGGLGYFVYRMFKGRQVSGVSPMNNLMSGNFNASGAGYAQQNTVSTTSVDVTDSDKAAFENLLIKIQQYWSEGELNKLRQVATPEMVQYFSEEMSANSSRGVANKVENVRLESADVIEAWREFELDYATVRLEWSALDYMVSLDKNQGEDGYVVSGSNKATEVAEEIWTFARSSGGNWLLSAIQQVN